MLPNTVTRKRERERKRDQTVYRTRSQMPSDGPRDLTSGEDLGDTQCPAVEVSAWSRSLYGRIVMMRYMGGDGGVTERYIG